MYSSPEGMEFIASFLAEIEAMPSLSERAAQARAEARTKATTPTTPVYRPTIPTPRRTPDALAVHGDNVYAVTNPGADGLATYTPLVGNWR
ncbi:MAG TPA: hypothetical protein VIS06_12665 [Mycobacteriales bacterium]|jgi:hypothetical protein